jgi:hypothetical protein
MQHWNSPSMGEPLLRGVPGLDGRQKIKKVEKEVYALWFYTPPKKIDTLVRPSGRFLILFFL